MVYAYKYIEFPIHYIWNIAKHKWTLQKTATEAIGRLYMIQPSEGEGYYLRILLTHVKDVTSFDNLKTINGHLCRSFKEAYILLGFLQDDTEWDTCLREASNIKSEK